MALLMPFRGSVRAFEDVFGPERDLESVVAAPLA